jgi:hypothetical protein
MPYMCFSYSADLPLSIGNRDATQRAMPGLRRMPHTCFSYSTGIRGRERSLTMPPPQPTAPASSPKAMLGEILP